MHCLMKTSRLSPIVRKMVGWSFWGKDSTTFNDVSQILRQNKLWLNSFSLFRFTDIFWYHCTYDGVISADACLNSLTWSSSYYRMQSTITVLLSFASHIYVYPLHLFWRLIYIILLCLVAFLFGVCNSPRLVHEPKTLVPGWSQLSTHNILDHIFRSIHGFLRLLCQAFRNLCRVILGGIVKL